MTLEPVDLRWGVETAGEAEEPAREMRVLNVRLAILPEAEVAPLSRITRSNAIHKRLRAEPGRGSDIDWGYVFSRRR